MGRNICTHAISYTNIVEGQEQLHLWSNVLVFLICSLLSQFFIMKLFLSLYSLLHWKVHFKCWILRPEIFSAVVKWFQPITERYQGFASWAGINIIPIEPQSVANNFYPRNLLCVLEIGFHTKSLNASRLGCSHLCNLGDMSITSWNIINNNNQTIQ